MKTQFRAMRSNWAPFRTIRTEAELLHFADQCLVSGYMAFDTEGTGLDTLTSNMVGISMATFVGGNIHAVYVPCGHLESTPQLTDERILTILLPYLTDPALRVILHNASFDMQILAQYGLELNNIDDTQLMSYVLTGKDRGNGMKDLGREYLNGYQSITFDDVVTNKGLPNFSHVRISDATAYSAEDSAVTLELWSIFDGLLRDNPAAGVYDALDVALLPALVAMQHNGIAINSGYMLALAGVWGERAGEIERGLLGQFSDVFPALNINSTQDIGKLVFEHLKLPAIIKTPGGKPSTAAKAFEVLADHSEVVAQILEYRKLTKLANDFALKLPRLVHPSTGRVHCSLGQTFTNTGRLTCFEPNLQQIPVRTKEGRELRAAFVARLESKLVVADYSQIELRILAHISGDEGLIEAFHAGHDIHKATAALMFGKTVEAVDKDERTAAKTLNFLLLYGGGASALAAKLKISVPDAYGLMDTYFDGLPGVEAWIEQEKSDCRARGHGQTLLGRIIRTPGVHSVDHGEVARALRQGVNGAIQGTAADLMRAALIRAHDDMKTIVPAAQMLLTVHDEIIFEAPDNHAQEASEVLQQAMETCLDSVIEWRVPIVADPGIGANWLEAKGG